MACGVEIDLLAGYVSEGLEVLTSGSALVAQKQPNTLSYTRR